MCELVNIGQREKDIPTLIYKNQSKLIRGVYGGEISPFVLPTDLFEFTFFSLSKIVAATFGLPSDFSKGSFGFKRSTQMKNNLSVFSGAKTFQEVVELSSNVVVEGSVLPFNEFKKIGIKIDNQYNKHWLETENQAAFRQSQAVDSWKEIQEDKEVFPFLQYSTIKDSRVRPDHKEQDGIIKRVDDPFWNTWYPPNDWNCRCIVIQLEKATVTKGTFPENDNPVFGTNVGKNGLVFPKKHPYFDVPKQFKAAQLTNFGFETPTDEQIKNLL
jgi:SPP1 gp7 family putative phage head morphogenesis protein